MTIVCVSEEKAAQHNPSVYEPQPKRCKRNSPLEEAILKDLMKDWEADFRLSIHG